MPLNWTNKVDGQDICSADDVNALAAAIKDLETAIQNPVTSMLPRIIVSVDSGSVVTASCNGKTVTGTSVNGTCSLDVTDYGTWTISAVLNGKTSTSASVTVDAVKIYNAAALQYQYVYGFTINEAQSDPTASVTYTDDATAFAKGSSDWDTSPLFKNIKPCLFNNGSVVGYLKRDDYTKFENGTAADITSGSAGDVMVEIPKMAYYMEKSGSVVTCKVFLGNDAKSVDSRYSYLPFSRSSEGDRDKIYIGAYLGYTSSGKLRSLSGKTPTANQTIGTFRTQAQANGTGYQQFTFYPLTLLQLLYIIKYGSLDSQASLGSGFSYSSNLTAAITGGTDLKGFCFGEATGKLQMKIFGIEDFWGNLLQGIDGVFYDSNFNILTTYKSFNNTGNGYLFNNPSGLDGTVYGYISAIQGTTQTGFILKSNKGSSSTYYTDRSSFVAGRLAQFGGDWSGKSENGAFKLLLNNPESSTTSTDGARLCYI